MKNMRVFSLSYLLFLLLVISCGTLFAATQAVYVLENKVDTPENLVKQLTFEFGGQSVFNDQPGIWCSFQGEKVNGQKFKVWVLGKEFFPKTLREADSTLFRYIFQEGNNIPSEYVHALTGKPVFPTIGGWEHIWPRPGARDNIDPDSIDEQTWPKQVHWL